MNACQAHDLSCQPEPYCAGVVSLKPHTHHPTSGRPWSEVEAAAAVTDDALARAAAAEKRVEVSEAAAAVTADALGRAAAAEKVAADAVGLVAAAEKRAEVSEAAAVVNVDALARAVAAEKRAEVLDAIVRGMYFPGECLAG